MNDTRKHRAAKLSPEEDEKLQAICSEYGATQSDVLRAALKSYRPSAKALAAIVRPVGLAGADSDTRARVVSRGGHAKAAAAEPAKRKKNRK